MGQGYLRVQAANGVHLHALKSEAAGQFRKDAAQYGLDLVHGNAGKAEQAREEHVPGKTGMHAYGQDTLVSWPFVMVVFVVMFVNMAVVMIVMVIMVPASMFVIVYMGFWPLCQAVFRPFCLVLHGFFPAGNLGISRNWGDGL